MISLLSFETNSSLIMIKQKQDNITRLEKEIISLEIKYSKELKTESDRRQEIQRIQSSITKSTNAATLLSKQNEMLRNEKHIIDIKRKQSEIQKSIALHREKLSKARQELIKEEEKERKKESDARKSSDAEFRNSQERLQKELDKQKSITNRLLSEKLKSLKNVTPIESTDLTDYDFFISHASEDKEDFVQPLYNALIELNARVWLDKIELKVGDSLRRKIDNGLSKSKFGIVVLSSSFFKKNWPQYELDGLVAREMQGIKVILPIWHKVSKNEVMEYSPSLADKVALNSSNLTIEEIAQELYNLIE